VYFVVPLLVLVAILQTTLLPHLSVGGARPDLMLLMVISWSLRRGLNEGVVWAFCGGLALDLLSGAPLGSSSLALIIVAILTNLVRGGSVRSRAALPWVMAALATFAYYGVLSIILAITGRPIDVGTIVFRHVLPSAVYNVVVVALVYSLLTRLDQRTGEPELRW